MRRICALISFTLILYSLVAVAQVTTGTISGTVSDSTGAVLPGAKMEILNEDTGVTRTVQSDAAGRYSAPALGLGKYQLTASREGFQTQVRKGIELTVGREAVVNLELAVGAITQKVEVTGEAPLVESTTSSLGSTVDDRTIRELPLNGRSYDQLALLQPGVVALGGGVGTGVFDYGTGRRFTVTGSRSYANSFLLDGTDINDHANATPGGAAGTNMGVDAIREFKILTSPLSAEYGRSSGAIISSVTRSGTNEFHGSAFEFIRNSVLDARNFFDPSASPPPFRRNQFGGSLGAPIKKDKTFFYGAYEGLRQGLGTTFIDFVPTVATKNGNLPSGPVVVNPAIKPFLALYPNPNGRDFGDGTGEYIASPTISTNEDYFMLRTDHQVSDKTSFFGRYSFDTDSVVNPTNDSTNGNLPNFKTATRARRQYSTLQMSDILSPALLNNFRFAYNRSFQATDTLPTVPLGPEYSFIPGLPLGIIQVGGSSGFVQALNPLNTFGTAVAAPRQWAYNLFQWADDVTYVKGRHSFKSGFNIERLRDNASENSSLRGVYSFAGLSTLVTATPSSFQGVPAGENAYRGFRQTFFTVYGQDDFKFRPRVTLNLGLRWEALTDPTAVNRLASNILSPLDPQFHVLSSYTTLSKKNIDPRVGLAWQLNSRGTSVLRSGFAVFNDQIFPQVYAANVAKLPPFYSILTVSNASFPNGYQQLRQTGALTILTIDSSMKSPTKLDYNLSFQQQLWKDSVVELAYIGSESYHVVGYAAVNSPLPTIVNGQKFFPAGAPRRNPNFGSISSFTTNAISNYNAFQIKLTRRSAKGLQYEVFYTFSKVIDLLSAIASGDTAREPQVYLDPEDSARNRGLASFDARHNVVFNANYLLPFRFGQKAAGAILGGWAVSAIGTFQSGQPFTPRVGSNQSRDGDNQNPDRPNLVPGRSNNPAVGGPNRYFDPTAFSLPAAGTFGNLGRNTIIGPGSANLDFSLEKNFAIRESLHAQFRAEFFNIFNHANFGLPATQVFTSSGAYNGSAGRITATTTNSRQIQFALKFIF